MAERSDDKMPTPSPSGMAVAIGFVLPLLIDELINNKALPRADAVRVLSNAMVAIERAGTHGAYADGRAFVAALKSRIASGE